MASATMTSQQSLKHWKWRCRTPQNTKAIFHYNPSRNSFPLGMKLDRIYRLSFSLIQVQTFHDHSWVLYSLQAKFLWWNEAKFSVSILNEVFILWALVLPGKWDIHLLYSLSSEIQTGSLLVEYISIIFKLSKMLFSLGLASSLSFKVVFSCV